MSQKKEEERSGSPGVEVGPVFDKVTFFASLEQQGFAGRQLSDQIWQAVLDPSGEEEVERREERRGCVGWRRLIEKWRKDPEFSERTTSIGFSGLGALERSVVDPLRIPLRIKFFKGKPISFILNLIELTCQKDEESIIPLDHPLAHVCEIGVELPGGHLPISYYETDLQLTNILPPGGPGPRKIVVKSLTPPQAEALLELLAPSVSHADL